MKTQRTTSRPDRADGQGALVNGTDLLERSSGWWRLVATAEVTAATVAVLADWFIPAVVLVAMAAASLVVRRRGPRSLGFHRPAHPWRLAAQMAAFAAAWTLLNVAVLIPVTNHLSGTRQDLSAFADLEGNLALLALYLTASWLLAAF
jgi:uncharacterized protein